MKKLILLLVLAFGVSCVSKADVEYFQKACKLDGGAGCYVLGNMYDTGTGVRQSDNEALEYFGKACDLKEQLGCEAYARMTK